MHKNIKQKLKRIADALKEAFLQEKYISEFQYKPQEPMEYICIPLNTKRKEGEMSKQYVTADELKKAADYLASTKEQGGCYHWKVATKDNKNICIVLGWTDGFDKNDPDKDKYQDDTWRLAVKVGYQPSNSIMQCDYDVDFNLPYNPDTGDVYDDCEYCIYETTDFGALAKDINYMARYVVEHWKELGHE